MMRRDAINPSVRPRPRVLRALGDAGPPEQIEIKGVVYDRQRTVKHDSWAVTALYQGPEDRVICKFNRQQSIFGVPMRWLGVYLAQRERRGLRRFADVAAIPSDCGEVAADGRVLRYACAHAFIEGHPLRAGERVDDDFFAELQRSVKTMHERDFAYVDLNKRDNIIVSDDGRPHLIDFQICFALPRWQPARALLLPLLRILQRGDDYHLLKHFIRHRRDLLTDEQADLNQLRPWPIRFWRLISTPFQAVRRRLLVRAGVRSGEGHAHTELNPPEGLRTEQPPHS